MCRFEEEWRNPQGRKLNILDLQGRRTCLKTINIAVSDQRNSLFRCKHAVLKNRWLINLFRILFNTESDTNYGLLAQH